MASWVSILLFLFWLSVSQAQGGSGKIPTVEFISETLINNVVQDPQTGRIYLGAVNNIFQLSPSLQKEARTETGPKKDAKTCTPPASGCQDTVLMPNSNKLLLVHPSNGSLIVCGSRYRGICSLLNLSNVEQELYYNDNKGERTYVASIEDNVNVVSVMSNYTKNGRTFKVFLVGKGYGSLDSTKLISTRILEDYQDWVVFENIIEASAVQTAPFVLKYLHDFQHAFKEDGFVYFLFSRTLDGTDNKNLTFVSRLCENDQHYYSYTELQLTCGTNNRYNKVQAAYVTFPGKELARVMSQSGNYGTVTSFTKVLFMVAHPDDDESDSALCMYPLNSINQQLMDIISACYSDSGEISGVPAVDVPYSSQTYTAYLLKCLELKLKDALGNFKCGAEHLLSPLASKPAFALKADAALTMSVHLTAVTVAVENDHTIAFLGSANGEVFKVEFSCAPLIIFHVVIIQITKVPVQTCLEMKDCQSCVGLRDPYCGWCVLEGRCTRRSECRRAEEKNGWLWSPKQQCVKIVSFSPSNLSCRKTGKVQLCLFLTQTVSDFLCSLLFVSHFNHCFTVSSDFVVVAIRIFVNETVELATREFMFYNCAATVRKSENTPCMSCVSSQWGCQWNTQDHTCSDADNSVVVSHIINANCPRFENPDPVLIPVGYKTRISFEGINLKHYQVNWPHSTPNMHLSSRERNTLFLFVDIPLTEKRKNTTGSFLVTLYNCAVERNDCSLCKNADPKYKCVWCSKKLACVYEKLCDPLPSNTECPDPEITNISPLFGPVLGGISITISGSNLGIDQGDIKSIRVAGKPCIHEPEKYSIGPADKADWGEVEIEVNGGKRGTSSVSFTYRDPMPEEVMPNRGPKAGGTLITISGLFLNAGSKEDVQLCPCLGREHFGENITCRTGEYRVDKVPSDPLDVVMKYGKRTTKSIPASFRFVENPTVQDHQPKAITALRASHSLFPLQGRGFSKAMTTKEAQAFVGDVQCVVNTLQDDKLFLEPPSTTPRAPTRSKHQHRETGSENLELMFGKGEWVVDSVQYETKNDFPLYIIIPAVIVPMLLIITISVYCYRRKSQQAEREYEKVKHQLENLEESVRDRCKKEFTDLMIEMEDHTNDLNEGRIPFLDYKTYTDRVFFLPSKDGANDVMITGKLDIPEARKATVIQSLNQFSNLLNSKTFLINFIRTLERSHDFNARAKVYFASLLTVALHGKLEYYTDIMRTLLLELMEEYVNSKNPKLMLRRSETVVERMLCNWMSICLYQFLKDSAGEPLYKLFKAIKHQIEKGPVDVRVKKAKYTLNDTGLLGDDVEYSVLTLQVLVQGEGPDVTPVKVLNCDTISQVKEKIIEQVYRNLPYSQRPKVDSVTLEWRPGSTGQILSDLDLTSQKEGRWKRINTLAHYNVRDNATLVLSKVQHTQQNYDQNQENHEERNALLEDDKVFHLVRPTDELDETKSKRGSIKDKSMTKAITEIYLTRLLSVKGTLQQFVDDFFRSVLCSGAVVPPAVKYFFDFLDEQALKHNNVDEETIHIWKTNSLPLRFWVNILKNPHFIFDVHVSEVVDASLSVIAQTFMDACTKSEHKLSRDSPSNKLLYAKEISTYKKMVDDYYKGIRQMVSVSDQDMNTHLAEVSRSHTDKLNTHVALHQLYQYASKYYDGIIASLEEDPAAQSKQLALRLQQIAAALENKVTDL
uniref:Sema domain-containing protein n=1 Tax=Astatotilapia calliptera TaxID=8154 RepID=A0AAX7TZF5_ASTCA